MEMDQKKLKRQLEKAGALVSVNGAGEVKAVQFVGKRTRDEHLELVAKALEIEKLIVSYSSITNAGIAHLTGLPKLRILSLFRNEISDAGIAHLKGMTQLQQLNLEETGLTDAGVPVLCTLTGLQRVSMDHQSVSDKAEASLQAALPNCQIFR